MGKPPLLFAAERDQRQAARALLAAGASIEGINGPGDTALHCALKNDDEPLALALLERGADPELRNDDGWAPLHLALHLGHFRAVRLLVRRGVDLNTPGPEGEHPLLVGVHAAPAEVVALMVDGGARVDAAGTDGRTALMIAAARKQRRVVEVLLDRGAPVNRKDRAGRTALMYAAGSDLQSGRNPRFPLHYPRLSPKVRDALAELERSLHHRPGNAAGPPPQVPGNPEEVVRLLLNAGADPNAPDAAGETVLAAAVRSGQEDLAALLAASGADPNAADAKGKTLLMRAAERLDPGNVRALMAHGARVDLRDRKGRTAFDWAEYGYRRQLENWRRMAQDQIRFRVREASRQPSPRSVRLREIAARRSVLQQEEDVLPRGREVLAEVRAALRGTPAGSLAVTEGR
jgi:cytohesin